MGNPSSWSNSQNKIYGQNSVSANSVVNIMSGTTTIKSYTSTKNVGYLYYTSPNVDSTYKFSVSTGSTTPGNDNDDDDDDIQLISSKGNFMNAKMFLIMIFGINNIN